MARLAALALLLVACVVQADNMEEELGKESPGMRAMNLGISVMLLLTITFIMLLFWLVHHRDADIKKYSWQVISATISIFCAVLLFQAFDGLWKYYFLPEGEEEPEEFDELVVNFAQMMVWFLLLQACLALIAGAVGCFKDSPDRAPRPGDKVKLVQVFKRHTCTLAVGHSGYVKHFHDNQKDKLVVDFGAVKSGVVHAEHVERDISEFERRKLMLKCWATLLGHITGFAAINFFAILQSQLPREGLQIFLVAPLAWMCVYVVSLATGACREIINRLDDGEEDENEKLWTEEVAETENDVVALSVSFIVTQWLRFELTGTLPSAEGEDPEDLVPEMWQIVLLFGFGMALSIWEGFRLTFLPPLPGGLARITNHMRDIAGMAMSWGFFFGFTWITTVSIPGVQGMLKQIIIAGLTTAVAVVLIFVLDKIADLDCTGPQVDKIVRSWVQCLGILIGFAWEKAFDIAVECSAVAAQAKEHWPTPVTKLCMSVVIAIIVIPNWRGHILPTIMKYIEEEEAEDEIAQMTGASVSDIEKTGATVEEVKEAIDQSIGLGAALTQPLMGGKPGVPPTFDRELFNTMISDYKNRVEELEKKNEILEAGSYIPPDVKRTSELERRNFELETNLVDVIQEIKTLQAIAGEPQPNNSASM